MDQVAVGAMLPFVSLSAIGPTQTLTVCVCVKLRTAWSDWEPLEQPKLYLKELNRWKKALRIKDSALSTDYMTVDLLDPTSRIKQR